MRVPAVTILAAAITSVAALPNPWPAPTATIDQRDANPMYCMADGHGTRCMPDKSKRTAAPMPAINAREPQPDPSETTTAPPSNGCFAFVENNQTVTHCEATTPQCNTYVGDDGIPTTACVLKRAAAPAPTLEARLAEPEPKPIYCVTDSVGTRCMPDRRAVVPTGWFTSGDAICTASASLTRCVPNKPRCTTFYDHQTVSRVECVL